MDLARAQLKSIHQRIHTSFHWKLSNQHPDLCDHRQSTYGPACKSTPGEHPASPWHPCKCACEDACRYAPGKHPACPWHPCEYACEYACKQTWKDPCGYACRHAPGKHPACPWQPARPGHKLQRGPRRPACPQMCTHQAVHVHSHGD
eukprot:scaffold91451_cov21-Tisochrysis_lutea.AAC.1